MQSTPIYLLPYPEVSVDPPNGATQIQGLAQAVEAALSNGTKALVVASVSAGGDVLTGSRAGVNATAVTSGTDTVAVTSYANLAGTGSTTSFSFTKRYGSTRVRVQVCASLYASVAGSGAMLGVRINGVDYDVLRVQCATANERYAPTGVAYLTGIGAGTYTVQGRWKRDNGTATFTRDVFDWLTIDAQEVA